MAERVAEIAKDSVDSTTGMIIDSVYSKVAETYAVYRTAERVMLQFADDPKLGSDQRLALSILTPVRGEINGLIDGWRISKRSDENSKAKLFDRRVADALTVALQGDPNHALDLLNAAKTDILEERTSIARTSYLGVSCATLVVFMIVVLVINYFFLAWTAPEFELSSLLFAAEIGALGAFFSISLSIRDRSIRTDLQNRDNRADAVLRIFIGAISAAILFCLLKGELVGFGFGGKPIPLAMNNAISVAAATVIAFAAGFSERLVGDLLTRSALTPTGGPANPLAGATVAASRSAKDANERNPLGRQTPGASQPHVTDGDNPLADEDGVDCCVADVEITEEEITRDVELPEASGGIERRSQ